MSWWTDRRDQFFDGAADIIEDTLGVGGEHVITVGHSSFPSVPINREDSLYNPLVVFNTIKSHSGESIGSQVRNDLIRGKSKLSKDIYHKSLEKPQFKNILSSHIEDAYSNPLQTYLNNQYANYKYYYTGTEFELDSTKGEELLAVIGEYDEDYWYVVYEDYNGLYHVAIPTSDVSSTLGILYSEDRLDDITTFDSELYTLNREATYPNIPIKLDGTMIKDAEDGTKEASIYKDCKDILGRKSYNSISNQFSNSKNDEDNSMQQTLANSDDILITFGLNIERDVPLMNKAMYHTLDRLYSKYRTSPLTDRLSKVGSSILEEQTMSSTSQDISKISTMHQMDIEYHFTDMANDNTQESDNGEFRLTDISFGGIYPREDGVFTRKVGYYDDDDVIQYVNKISDIEDITTTIQVETYDDEGPMVLVDKEVPLTEYFIEYNATYETHVDTYRLSALKVIRNIQKGTKSHSSIYSMADMVSTTAQDKGSLCLPFFEDVILDKMKFSDRYNIIDLSMHVVVLYYKDTYLHWYETGAFLTLVQIVLYIVAIIIVIVTVGYGSPLSAYIVALAQAIAIAVALQLAVKWVFTQTDNALVRVLAVVVSIIISIYSGGGDLSSLTTVETALHVVNAVNMYVNVSVDVEMYDLQKEAIELKKEYDEYNDYITELNEFNHYNTSGDSIIVDILAKYTPVEEPNEFYDRILSTTDAMDIASSALAASIDVNTLTRI